jgi:heat shock protein HslJ
VVDNDVTVRLRAHLRAEADQLDDLAGFRAAAGRFDQAFADLVETPSQGQARGSRWGAERGWRRRLLPALAAVVAVLAVGAVSVASWRDRAPAPGRVPSAGSSTSRLDVGALLKSWTPLQGQRVWDSYASPAAWVPLGGTIRFYPNGTYGGVDRCNSYGGNYTATDRGQITFSSLGETAVGCLTTIHSSPGNIPVLVEQTRRWSITSGRLTLADSKGRTLAVFTPTRS